MFFIAAIVHGGELLQQHLVNGRMQNPHSLIGVVAATNKLHFQVKIDNFCRDTVCEDKSFSRGGGNYAVTPFPVLCCQVFWCWQLARTGKRAIEPARLKNCDTLMHFEPAQWTGGCPSRSGPSGQAVLVLLDGIWHG